jgi:hypothetical protein
MQCTQRLQLEKIYQEESAALAAARRNLHERMAVCPRAEFLRLSAAVNTARAALEQAKTALDDHVENHCCLTHGGELPA